MLSSTGSAEMSSMLLDMLPCSFEDIQKLLRQTLATLFPTNFHMFLSLANFSVCVAAFPVLIFVLFVFRLQ